ncbi:SPW repeat protein [Nocardia yamanashiensis]|uniref:SPW repeat domain-containing protein n=1 Tax=Nocardia yamanashiensis TaxID=209247 RepID=UPI001E3A3BC9|nr:SPW repeat protein [Nocardia yamanashiensis]UGT39138.1 SPW repeat protein [Nocardia yamanashiensis]
MFTESRTQDAVAVVLGAFTALSTLWVDHSDKAFWTLVVLGVLIAATGLGRMAKVLSDTADYALGLLGVLLFVSPWVMSFDNYSGASWTAWVVGALTVVIALAAMPAVSTRLHAVTHH